MPIVNHPDAVQIIDRFNAEGIESFFHFTSIDNLPNISRTGALCSKQILEENGEWPCTNPGGNDLSHNLDRCNENWDKVALNLTTHTPMAWHKKHSNHLCFFIVSNEVAGWTGTYFTNTNAASNDHERESGLPGINLINFEMIKSNIRPGNSEWKKLVQAEVLVPDQIPWDYVRSIAFVSQTSLDLGKRMWGCTNHPPFTVNKELFLDTPDVSDTLCGFPYISEVILTNSNVSKDNVREITLNQTQFQRRTSREITMIAKINTLPGTVAKTIWNAEIELQTMFQKTKSGYWWKTVAIDDLPNGISSLKITLNDLPWAIVDFEVQN